MAYRSNLDFGPYGNFGTVMIPTENQGVSMPSAVPAIIGGVASLGGALIGNKAQSNSQKSSERANAQALAYQREQDAARRQDYQQAMAIWDANRRAWLARYGINLGGAPMGQPGPMVQAQPTLGGPTPGVMGGQPMGGRPKNLREILMAKGGGMPDAMGGWRRSSSY